MKFILKTNDGRYFEQFHRGPNGYSIITNSNYVVARQFTMKEFREGIVNDLIYKASTKYGLNFNLIIIEDNVDLPKTYEDIFEVFKNQYKKGIEKYGQDVDKSDLSAEEWIDHSIEEIADMMVYLVKLKEKLKEMTKNVEL